MGELSTGVSWFLGAFALLFVFFCSAVAWLSLRLVAYCRAAVEFVRNQNKNSVSLRKMAEVEATLTDLSDSYEALLESHRKLRSRIGMRKIRQKRQDDVNSDSVPSGEAEKARYKAALRAQLQREGRL